MATATIIQAYRFALDPTPAQRRALASHVGAGRVAFNRMLAEVKATLEARDWERRILGGAVTAAQGWSLPALRRRWNEIEHDEYPWWPAVSKEAFNTGLDGLARALENWSASRGGERAGAAMRFPRFRRRDRGPQSVRFTTGAIRVERDRHHVVLPRVGRVRTHESTRKLARRIDAGTARILSATVTTAAGRWFCSFTVEVQRDVGREAIPAQIAASAHPVIGVDAGVKTLATVAAPDGTVVHVEPHPQALAAVGDWLRRLDRRAARQQPRSKRWRRTQQRIAAAHRRAANVRRDAICKLTTRLAQRHDVVVVEDLNLAAMGRRKPGAGSGGRGFNRKLRDGALGELRRQLGYKTGWYAATLVVADRWYPSSKTCSGCGERKPSLRLHERSYHCEHCGLDVDRDVNAAINLARLGEHSKPAGSGPVTGRGADQKTPPTSGAGGREASTPPEPTLGQTGPPLRKVRLPETDAYVSDNGTQFVHMIPDAISRAAAPIEHHGRGPDTDWRFLEAGSYYEIPMRCLLPADLDRVVVAGRCLSASHDAHASARNMAQCMAMGQAAGTAAAMVADAGASVSDVDAGQLRKTLIADGALLDPEGEYP